MSKKGGGYFKMFAKFHPIKRRGAGTGAAYFGRISKNVCQISPEKKDGGRYGSVTGLEKW